jgi:hypothetical protein
MDETRIHPIWKEAAMAIAARVAREGYGFTIDLDELYAALETKRPRAHSFWKDVKKSQFDFLEKVEELKRECLHKHNLYLHNVRGRGYKVLAPDDQVTIGWERQHDKARKHLRKSLDVLANVAVAALSDAGQKNRDRNINRTVFIMAAANKRKIPAVEKKMLD